MGFGLMKKIMGFCLKYETMKQFIASEQNKIRNKMKRQQNKQTRKIKISYKSLGNLLRLFGQQPKFYEKNNGLWFDRANLSA